LIFAALVLNLTGVLHRGPGFRWQAAGLLIVNTAADASAFAHHHGLAHSQLLALDRAILAVILAGVAILMVGLRSQEKERQKARQAE